MTVLDGAPTGATTPARPRTTAATPPRRRRRSAIALSAGGAVVVLVLSICVGAYWIPITDVFATVAARLGFGPDRPSVHDSVVWDIRLVRTLLAGAVGAALATSGAAFQATFRNPLVEPYILGVSSGAAFGAGLAVLVPIPMSMQVSAFLFGALAVTAATTLAGREGRRSTVTLILAGVIVGGFFTAAFALFQYLGTDAQLRRLVFWVLGGFYTARWDDVALVLPLTVLGVGLLWMMAWRLNLLTLGDQECRSLGVDPVITRRTVVGIATALTALAVSVSGVIAWVGLLVPHAARMIAGADNRTVVPLSALLGASFVMVCDDLARTLHSGELPIGIITAALGTPFLMLLLRRRGTSWAG